MFCKTPSVATSIGFKNTFYFRHCLVRLLAPILTPLVEALASLPDDFIQVPA